MHKPQMHLAHECVTTGDFGRGHQPLMSNRLRCPVCQEVARRSLSAFSLARFMLVQRLGFLGYSVIALRTHNQNRTCAWYFWANSALVVAGSRCLTNSPADDFGIGFVAKTTAASRSLR